MEKKFKIQGFLSFCALFFFICTYSQAEDKSSSATLLGVFQSKKIEEQSTAFKQFQEFLGNKERALKTEAMRDQEKLHKEQSALSKEQKSLSPDKIKVREEQLQKKMDQFRAKYSLRLKEISLIQSQTFGAFQEALNGIVQKIAKEKGLSCVCSAESMLWFSPALDITQPVITLLNSQVPAMKIIKPSEAELKAVLPKE